MRTVTPYVFSDFVEGKLNDCAGDVPCIDLLNEKIARREDEPYKSYANGAMTSRQYMPGTNFALEVARAEKSIDAISPDKYAGEKDADFLVRQITAVKEAYSLARVSPKTSIDLEVYNSQRHQAGQRQAKIIEHKMPSNPETSFYEDIANKHGNRKFRDNVVLPTAFSGIAGAALATAPFIGYALGNIMGPPIVIAETTAIGTFIAEAGLGTLLATMGVAGLVVGAAALGAGYAYYKYTSNPDTQLENAVNSIMAEDRNVS